MTKANRLTHRAEALEQIVDRLAHYGRGRHLTRYLAFKDALTRVQRHEMSSWADGIAQADAANFQLGAY